MDGDWNHNYGPGGHAEQIRNGLWGKTEPAAASFRSCYATAAPLIWLDGKAFLVRTHAQQLPQQPTRSIEPESEPTEVEPTEIEPTEPEPIEPEPTHLELFDPKPSPSLESPAEESEEASSSSGNSNGAIGERNADSYRFQPTKETYSKATFSKADVRNKKRSCCECPQTVKKEVKQPGRYWG